MKINFFCPRWGSEHIPFSTFIKMALDEGYEGVEVALPPNKQLQKEYLTSLADYGIPFILQHGQADNSNVDDYILEYTARLEILADAKPLFINAQTGKDFYTFEDNCRIIEKAIEIEAKTGVPIYQETHRGKFSFACHLMPRYLNAFPQMKITADFSHWVNVSESLLEYQQATIDRIVPNVHHIHARVGYIQGPQVNHPASPGNRQNLDRHLEWWDAIVKERKEMGDSEFTITSEFGPPPYMPVLPFTEQPVSSQWEINKYMKNLLRSRYLG